MTQEIDSMFFIINLGGLIVYPIIGPNSKDRICKLLVEKNGVRAIERIMEIHRDTVSDVIEDLARHAREVTDYLITNVGLTQIQVDEMWSFVKKTKES